MSDETTPVGQIHAAMLAIMRDIEAIEKREKNREQGWQFRGIDTVYNELHSLFAKHGVYMTSEVETERTEDRVTHKGSALIYRVLRIRFVFHAADGSTVASIVIGEGMDGGDKAANKAMSIAHKSALLQAFLVPTKEEKDPDFETHEVLPRPPPAPPPPKPPPPKDDRPAWVKACQDDPKLAELVKQKGLKRGDCQMLWDEAVADTDDEWLRRFWVSVEVLMDKPVS